MPLTEAQIIDGLLLLGLPARIDVAVGYTGGDGERNRHGAIARQLLENLSTDQQNKVTDILTQWTTLQYDTDLVKAEGLDSNPERARQRLAMVLRNVIGYTWERGGFTISRG